MAEDTTFDGIRPGIYNVDYFSGSQVALYIGDVFVDEVTSLAFSAQQNRRPLYGYGDQYFRALSKGQILIQGQFTVNFKEAGYLWLVLERYKRFIKGGTSKLNPFIDTDNAYQQNIEKIINGEVDDESRKDAFSKMTEVYASLTGFSSTTRAAGKSQNITDKEGNTKSVGIVGNAENIFETFENYVWGGKGSTQKTIFGVNQTIDVSDNRNVDDPDLNPFDMYIMYGDFAGDDRANHTIIKLEDVAILGSSQRIEIDGQPIQEAYSFIAKKRV